MTKTTIHDGYDVVIAGAGPGGCVLAKDLARKGKRVAVLEQGDDSRAFIGTPFAMVCGKHTICDFPKTFWGKLTANKKFEVIIGKGLGGGTKTYGANAVMPDFDLWRRHDIDLESFIEEAKEECWVSEIPEKFIGDGAKRIQDGYAKMGLSVEPGLTHINYDLCKVGCKQCAGSGCKIGARWEGKMAAEDAIEHGAEFIYHAVVDKAIVENGKAVGFKATIKGSPIEVRGKVSVCACGGYGSVMVAKKSGIKDAGNTFTGDPCVITFGYIKGLDNSKDNSTASVFSNDLKNGCFFMDQLFPFPVWLGTYATKEGPFSAAKDIGKYKSAIVGMCKIHDEDKGYVAEDGSFDKTFTKQDEERLAYTIDLQHKIFEAAGCDPKSIHDSTPILGHPSGTVPIGKALDKWGESVDVPNLYFCDSSIFPEALGIPVTLNIVNFAKYFSNHLLTSVL
ncbi:hypothetical protein DSCO28_26240 [Desulfosarcina ovata subsp. sediminis]|uniref:GMC family oxidoreductase n=1 Tax=Desulfosarcina ovata subsp. sediminis TaxID=885957 RepID=A0A5K7ZIK6_9BACT|nr:GMC family oxidoreductase N-terminal domain-containing protein [Desulfosarcina ovata]BBO82058.1 hypothetical protein DSCO28_26240 [Desulfosarcina ovata subsp. sediminis]